MNYIARAKAAQKFLAKHGDPDVVTVSLFGYIDEIDIQTTAPLPGFEYKQTSTERGVGYSGGSSQDDFPIRLSAFVAHPAVVVAA